MPYQITNYTKAQAKKLNVDIKPSTNRNKKIDVFKKGEKIASVGAIGYNDYPTFLKEKGFVFANKRRKLYKLRHSKDRNIIGTNGFYADKLLW